MDYYPTLRELLLQNPQSKQLFDRFSPDAQVALQEQRQNIHTYADLQKIATSFADRSESW
ncbi:MAG: hypothetical protein RSB91_02055 [Clostridia bacterium]